MNVWTCVHGGLQQPSHPVTPVLPGYALDGPDQDEALPENGSMALHYSTNFNKTEVRQKILQHFSKTIKQNKKLEMSNNRYRHTANKLQAESD